MKSTLYRKNETDTKQRVNELVNPMPKNQSVTLYNADSPDFLSQRCVSLHSLLQNIREIEFCVETTGLCLRPIQDLLNSSRTLLQNFSTSPEEDLWVTYAGLFAEFTNQIEHIISEAQHENKNLLMGDTLELTIEDNDAYNFQVKGKDLNLLLDTLRELSSEELREPEELHSAYNQLETINRTIEALAVILKGTEAVLKSKKVFTQKRLRQTMEKLNALKFGQHEELDIETPRFQSLTQMIGNTRFLPGPSETSATEESSAIEEPPATQEEFVDDSILKIADTLEKTANGQDNEQQPYPTPPELPEQFGNAPATDELVLNPPFRPELEKQEEEKGLSSIFPLFGVGRREKKHSGPGIRTILDRLHINETRDKQASETANTIQEPVSSPFGETADVDKLCLELLYKLDGKQIPFLEKRFHNGENTLYAEALGQYLKENKTDLKTQFNTDEKLKELMNQYEQIFHKLVKANYKANPDDRDRFIKEWLSSPYGAVYKIIFPILKNRS